MADRDPALLSASLLRPSLVHTLFFVAIAAASLVLIDSMLARTERRETAAEAARFDRDGQRLMRQSKYADAADAFRSAIANARDNPDYPLALGQALLGAGQLDEAGTTLTDLLKADPMAGAPNLAMARVFAKEAQFAEAAFYYHRAIYGQWKEDPPGNRVRSRFELADLLARRNSKAELLAELLPLQDQAPADPGTQARLARLFLTAGSPQRAAAIFLDLARTNPRDPEAYLGLGEAEFAHADYPAAQAGFIAALKLRPGDPSATKGLELCDRVLNLDPMRRGLDVPERYRRSIQVLRLVVDKVGQCPPPADLVSAANAALASSVPAAGQSEAVESNLELANKLWQAERATCTSAVSDADEPLQLVLAKSAQ